MSDYIASNKKQISEMLDIIGVSNLDELYAEVDSSLKDFELDLPDGLSELELRDAMAEISQKNKQYRKIFRGAGAYNHFIPSIVKSIAGKEEFVTSYTPYQPELNQGTLQAIFEYQTMISEITGLEVSNSSIYDGAGAAAEAVSMCCDKKRSTVLVASTADPMTIKTIKTYAFGADHNLKIINNKSGVCDLDELKSNLDDNCASLYLQHPNYFGNFENVDEIVSILKEKKIKLILGVNPIAYGVMKSAGEYGADIAVGDAQPLGMPLSFGGPYLGYMACNKDMMRKLPGRIVGQTVDSDNKRAFVLTLQTREQHIRREKASSNVCSNQALCALTAAVHMSALGKDGFVKTSQICYDNAHYLAAKICEIKGFEMAFDNEFFHEFVIKSEFDDNLIISELAKKDILGGLVIKEGILWCATEMCTKAHIDEVVSIIQEVTSQL